MEPRTKISWFVLCIFLVIMCVASMAMDPAIEFIHEPLKQSEVGLEALLPCMWESHTKSSSYTPYIQWQTLNDMVYERMGSERFQAEAYRDRADIPESMLALGNCSLHLMDIRFSDAGIYESYLVTGSGSNKRRIFLQSVQLLVHDHKSLQWVDRGKHLTLELYTPQAEMVVFQRSDDHNWDVLWQRGNNGGVPNQRVKKKDRKLIIRNVNTSDEGFYKVLDAEGLALSTVKVLVREPAVPTEESMEKFISLEGSAGTYSSSLHISVSLLLLLLFFL